MAEQVKIISATEITTYPTPGQPRVMVAITYTTLDLPPRTVYIDKAQDSEQERIRVIQADLREARARGGPTVLEIP